jgi:hypothetical protein
MDSEKDATENLGSSRCSTAVDAYQMRRTRERLALSPAERQRAIAEFPLRVANIAKDLLSMCDVRDSGQVMRRDSEEVMRYMEDRIRQCYREMFGTELGQ